MMPMMNKQPINTAVNKPAVNLAIFSFKKIAAKIVENTGPVYIRNTAFAKVVYLVDET